jgi:hypothetical protein
MLNKCPTLAIKNITPEKAWSGMKPYVDYFWVFDYITHVHVPKVRRTKLDNISFMSVCLGVSKEFKGYRLFNTIIKKIVVSRDMIFEEEKQWDWNESYEEQILIDLEWGDDAIAGVDDNKGEDGENINGVKNDGEDVSETNSGKREGDVSPNNRDVEDNEDGNRIKEPSAWMRDYVSGEGLGLSEDEGNLAPMVSSDPLYYEEAVKDAS